LEHTPHLWFHLKTHGSRIDFFDFKINDLCFERSL
jgi:hypothetical protein